MKAVNKGFTLIELMIVVAVIGVLAAIAIPQYQNYVAKAELGSALSTLASLKTNVEDKLANDGAFPTTAQLTDLGAPTPNNGTITVATGSTALVFTFTSGSEKVSDAVVTLARTAGTSAWQCSVTGSNITAAITPKGCTPPANQ